MSVQDVIILSTRTLCLQLWKWLGKSDMVRWVILHQTLDNWTCAWYSRPLRVLDSYSEGVQWLYYSVKSMDFCCHDQGACILLGPNHTGCITSSVVWSITSCVAFNSIIKSVSIHTGDQRCFRGTSNLISHCSCFTFSVFFLTHAHEWSINSTEIH